MENIKNIIALNVMIGTELDTNIHVKKAPILLYLAEGDTLENVLKTKTIFSQRIFANSDIIKNYPNMVINYVNYSSTMLNYGNILVQDLFMLDESENYTTENLRAHYLYNALYELHNQVLKYEFYNTDNILEDIPYMFNLIAEKSDISVTEKIIIEYIKSFLNKHCKLSMININNTIDYLLKLIHNNE